MEETSDAIASMCKRQPLYIVTVMYQERVRVLVMGGDMAYYHWQLTIPFLSLTGQMLIPEIGACLDGEGHSGSSSPFVFGVSMT